MSPSTDDQRPVTDSTADDPAAIRRGRSPVASVTLAFVIGILIDRTFLPGWAVWMTVAAGVLAGALVMRNRSAGIVTLLLLGCTLAVGGMRHHLSVSAVAADDVSLLAEKNPRPIRVIGVVTTPMTILAANPSQLTPPWMRIDRSRCDVRCEMILAGDEPLPVSGTARLMTTGHVLHADVGDRVEIVGQLVQPRLSSNPGAFDYREYLQRQGVRCLIDCDHPDAVRLLAPKVSERLSRMRAELRGECEQILVQHLDRKTLPLAVSLLLGLRSQLPGEVRTAFAESGTMHLLAISGLHVGILAGLLLIGCRLLNLSVPVTTIVLLLGICGYAFVTNLRPPVVRASVLAVAVAAAWPASRRVSPTNLIAICALVVLLMDPTDLFDTGTQLSFLAVIAIGWAAAFIARQRRRSDTESLLPRLFAKRDGWAKILLRVLAEGYVVTTAIWLFTLPLTVAQFHIAAPVGFLINVLLIPYVALLLAVGFVTMACGLLLPSLVRWPAMLFDWSLDGLLGVVDSASALHLGHRYLPGPPGWWLPIFYGLLGGALLFRSWPAVRRWGWQAVWCWVIVCQFAAFHTPRRETLRCTFLDMGHGCCVILELPGGENLLYDAGLLGSDRRGRQIVQSALWQRGIDHLDGIMTSHADIDHFNVAAGLMSVVPVGTLLISRSFLDFDQPPVALLCDAASREHVPIRLVQAGDRLLSGDSRITLDVLQPADRWQGESDNANSLVVRIEFGGRSVLLPGDLDGNGLTELMSGPPQQIDVLLAPHHGNKGSNPPSLALWATPLVVLVSGGDDRTAALERIYTEAEQILCTHNSGAVTVEITAEGDMTVRPIQHGQ